MFELLIKRKQKRGKMKSKKAQNITVTTIIIIILALVVLVVLILGFTGGWGQLWSKITSFFGKPNVDTIVQACSVACTTESKYEYCSRPRTIRTEDKIFLVNYKGGLLSAGTAQYKEADFNKAKTDYDNAERDFKTAKTAYDAAKKEYDAAAEADKAAKKTAMDNAEKIYDEKKTAMNKAEEAYVKLAAKDKTNEAITTCKQLATSHPELGIQPCTALDCA